VGRIRDACRDLEKNHSLYDLATKYDWDEYLVWDVLRGRRQPPVACAGRSRASWRSRTPSWQNS